MARISTYVIDGTIVDRDKVIGSDANNDMQTKNYTVGDLVNYFAASIGGNFLVPYIGANNNVDLGAFDLSATNITISGNFTADGTAGLPGQALLSQGSGFPAIWGYVAGTQDLASVLNIGNTGTKNINLNTINGYARIDVEKIYGEPAMYLYSSNLNTASSFEINKLHLEDSAYKADYSTNKIRYTLGGNYIDLVLNSYNNQSFIFPAVGGFIPVSVNGNFSDASGNINIPLGGGGTVTNIGTSSPLTGGPINVSGTIGITQSDTITDGYLSSTDWNIFDGKQDPITLTTIGTGAATFIGNVLNIPIGGGGTFTSLTTTGDSGASTLIGGVLNVPTYTLAGLGGQPLATNLTSLSGLTYASTSFVKMTANGTFGLDTNTYLTSITSSDVTTALGYTPVTNARQLTINGTTYDLTADRSWSVGTVTGTTATSPLASSGGTTPNITIQQANGSQNGYLSSTDWNIFNGKQDPITLTTTGSSGAATFIANVLNVPQYSGGGSTNPTNLFVPYNNAGTFADSYLINDTASSILKSTYLGTDAGIYLDFLTEQYYIGDTTNTNYQSYAVFNAGASGSLLTLVSFDNILGKEIDLSINASAGVASTAYSGNDVGFKLDFANGTYVIGDNTSTDYQTYANFFGGISANTTYLTLVSNDLTKGQSTSLNLDATNAYAATTYNAVYKGIYLDFLIDQYYLGDTTSFVKVNTLNANTTISTLTGIGTRMVVADASGVLSTQIVPVVGITSLNALTVGAQNFIDDTNVTIVSSGSDHTITWAGTLDDGRITSASTWNGKQDALSGTGIVLSTAGTISYLTNNTANWDAAYTARLASLTTTGAGAATFIANVLNIPTPPAPIPATFTSLTTIGDNGASTLIGGVLNVPTYTLAGLGGVSGSGTTNYIPKFTGTSTIGNSSIQDNGAGIITISPAASVDNIIKLNSTITSGSQFPLNAIFFQNANVNRHVLALNSSGDFLFESFTASGVPIGNGVFTVPLNSNTFGINNFSPNTAYALDVTGKVLLRDLLGLNTRMVVVDSNGELQSQAIPSGTSPLTTKGDIYTYSTADARLGVGSNGQVLIADSSTTTGLKWDTPASGGTVTSVAALTLGTSGTDLSSTVANGTTTPVITLNVPDAGASARGVVTTAAQTIAGAKTFSTAPILSSLTASQVLALDGSGNIQSLAVATYPSLTELSYVKGVTSAIQTQIGTKQATITGAATTITSSDLTVSRALVSNASGKVAVSTVTDTELGYVSGVTSDIQTQIGTKANLSQATYTMLANNTGSTANMTTQTFRDNGETAYTGTITWTGTTNPTSVINNMYQWSQIGKEVSVYIILNYTNPSSAITSITLDLPSGLPTPYSWTGFTSALSILYTGNYTIFATTTTSPPVANRSGELFLRRNSANNGYELVTSTMGVATARVFTFRFNYRAL